MKLTRTLGTQAMERYVERISELLSANDRLVIGLFHDLSVEQLAFRVKTMTDTEPALDDRVSEFLFADRDGELGEELQLDLYDPQTENTSLALHVPVNEFSLGSVVDLLASCAHAYLSGMSNEQCDDYFRSKGFLEDTERIMYHGDDGSRITWRHYSAEAAYRAPVIKES